jgi:hypothetical protein
LTAKPFALIIPRGDAGISGSDVVTCAQYDVAVHSTRIDPIHRMALPGCAACGGVFGGSIAGIAIAIDGSARLGECTIRAANTYPAAAGYGNSKTVNNRRPGPLVTDSAFCFKKGAGRLCAASKILFVSFKLF